MTSSLSSSVTISDVMTKDSIGHTAGAKADAGL